MIETYVMTGKPTVVNLLRVVFRYPLTMHKK